MTTTEVATPVASLLLGLDEVGVTPTPVSLDFNDPNMEYVVWEDVGRKLGTIERASRWFIGDWLVAGETLYGEDHAQGVEATTSERFSESERVTGLDHQTLLNISSVCRRVKRMTRRPELPFAHHSVVAPLADEQQAYWLAAAIEHGWSQRDLRQAIRGENPDADDEYEQAPTSVGSGTSPSERLSEVAELIYAQAQATGRGVHEVPDAAIHQLAAALGRG